MQRSTHLHLAALATALALAAACGVDPRLPEQSGPGGAPRSQALVASEVLATGAACTPNGAHGKHATYSCTTCHVCGGVLQFDPTGPAVAAGKPAPSFDATAKTCSNVACHGVPTGTFSYYFPDGNGDPELKIVNYGGTQGLLTTASWYASGTATCASCHGYPPQETGGAWHSGLHGGQSGGALNACTLCHPGAPGSRHNGALDVQPEFKSSCFGCH